LVLGGCLVAFATGCGGGRGISSADALKADHRIGLIPAASADVAKVERVGEWSGQDVLTAWVKVTLKEGAPYFTCISVDILGPIQDENDLSLVITTPPDSACKAPKPKL